LTRLRAAPYSLILGDTVDVKIAAINLYGTSGFSAIGTGAFIQLVPDAPLSLADNPVITSATVIGLTWSNGLSNGGSAVIDYRVYYDRAAGDWIELASGIATRSY